MECLYSSQLLCFQFWIILSYSINYRHQVLLVDYEVSRWPFKFLPISIKSLLGSWNHMGWAAPSLMNNVEEKRKASSHRKVLQIIGTKCITEFCMKWVETNHLRTVKATPTQTDPWIDLSHFVIWPRFCVSKNFFFVCVYGLALFVLFGLRLSFFGWSIWILVGWIVIWIIICFVDWYYFGWFYLEFVFSGWLDWNLMQVNCIDMHGMHWCVWIIGSLGNWSPSNA